LEKDDPRSLMASTELVVHRAIYRKTATLAVVHAHPPYATLLSMVRDQIVPVDSEGTYYFKEVGVVTPQKTIGSEEAAHLVSERLKDSRIVLMRGHGSFARGDSLEEAFMLTTSLESSCFYLYHLDRAGQ
jgi:L-fuculose-phosphate aldolase